MNIFVVDLRPTQAARDLCDKHVSKMHTESVQLLVSLANNRGIDHNIRKKDGELHKGGYPHHPCTKWLERDMHNVRWLLTHAFELCFEHQRRFGRLPFSYGQLNRLLGMVYPSLDRGLPSIRLTEFPQCMPDDCLDDDVVTAYRSYYIKHKSYMARWNHCDPPAWYSKAFETAGVSS